MRSDCVRVVVGFVHEKVGVGALEVTRVLHRERDDVIPVSGQFLDQLEQIGLDTPFRVPELVAEQQTDARHDQARDAAAAGVVFRQSA